MTGPVTLATPEPGDEIAWVARHLGDLCLEGPEGVASSTRWSGRQSAADAALAGLDPRGYGANRSRVAPMSERGATGLSPWIRHGLLTLPRVWKHLEPFRGRDADKLRDELHWQEYARHLYARMGSLTTRPLRARPRADASFAGEDRRSIWDRSMVCVEENLRELETDGWMVNQSRMWLASQWSVRGGAPWREGEDHFFRHLLDGSRAANRMGWQWTAGTATGRPYGFSRTQVERQAPEWCRRCPHARRCPIEHPPIDPDLEGLEASGLLRRDPDLSTTAGPRRAERRSEVAPEAVWLTAESLGDEDPALVAHRELPVVFVFDEALLAGLRLSGKRLVFLVERLAELATCREVEILRGDPVSSLRDRSVAVTFAPVPGFRERARLVRPDVVYPWPWLVAPGTGPVSSFSAWRSARGIGRRR